MSCTPLAFGRLPIAIALLAIASVTMASGTAGAKKVIPAAGGIGVNVERADFRSATCPFVDAYTLSSPWKFSQLDGTAVTDDRSNLDVVQLKAGETAETVMMSSSSSHYPAGVYTLFYAGNGALTIKGCGRILDQEPGKITIKVKPQLGPLYLGVTSSSAADPIRDVRVILPGYENSYQTKTFTDTFVDQLRGSKIVRFQKWIGSDSFNLSSKARRATNGVPLKAMVDLCNQLGASPWFNIPAQFRESEITEASRFVESQLRPSIVSYVELSSELWDHTTPDGAYAESQVKNGSQPWVCAASFAGERSKALFEAWEAGSTRTFARVIAIPVDQPEIALTILQQAQAKQNADILAVRANAKFDDAARNDNLSVDELFQSLDQQVRSALPAKLGFASSLAEENQLSLVAYSGGIESVATGSPANRVMELAMEDPRMERTFELLVETWKNVGGSALIRATKS